MKADLTVLWKDRHWLAVTKPSGIPTTAPAAAGVQSLVDRVRQELSPDTQHCHPLSRLDVEVTGVVLFALTHKAIEAAQHARQTGRYHRRYVALLATAPEPPYGTWTWSIGIDPRDPRKRLAGGGRDSRPAMTDYVTLARAGPIARVAMDLSTGRTHQIRVHAQRAGCPVVGDRLYGGPRHITLADGTVVTARRVMLHAMQVQVPGSELVIEASPPADFEEIWRTCGGVGGQ